MARGFGLPTVSTKQSPDHFGDSLVGTHVQPGDIQALARAITEVLNRGKSSSGRTVRASAPKDSWASLAKLIEEMS